MVTLVIGGSASGKSEYAENLLNHFNEDKVYMATMQPFGPAADLRIAKHRVQRAGKGFDTVETPTTLDIKQIDPEGKHILFEDLPNLLANELFGRGNMDVQKSFERVILSMQHLIDRADDLVIVTGDMCSDGCDYGEETDIYLQLLGVLHHAIAAQADNVIEVVAGLPNYIKGDLL